MKFQVAIIIPRNNRIQFFLTPKEREVHASWLYGNEEPKSPIKDWLSRLSAALHADSTDIDVREDLEQICNLVVDRFTSWRISEAAATNTYRRLSSPPFPAEVLSQVLKIAVDLRNKSLFLSIYDLRTNNTSVGLFKPIGVALVRFDLDYLRTKYG